MSDGCSSGPVVLTLAGPRPFLLVLVLHCPGRVRFFEILAIVSYYLLSPLIIPPYIAARVVLVFIWFFLGGFGVYIVFFFFFLFLPSASCQ